jgi:hypothetical protein
MSSKRQFPQHNNHYQDSAAVSYKPEFKGPIEGFVVNYLSRQLWRIARTHTHDDAMQEAYIVFMRCAERYPDLDTPQHFMALFKTSWRNEFTDLAYAATEAKKAVSLTELSRIDDSGDEIQVRTDSVGETDNGGALALMIAEAPQEVLMVLHLFLSAPTELLELAQRTWRDRGKNSAGGERWVEKMLGLKEGSDPIRKTEDYFTK